MSWLTRRRSRRRSPCHITRATRQLASRARRQVRDTAPVPDGDLSTQWRILDAFAAAARDGDFDALVAVLDPDVVLRADLGAGAPGRMTEVRGATLVAKQAAGYASVGLVMRPALVNGAAGAVSTRDGQLFSVGGFTVRGGKIVEIDILADPARLHELDLTALGAA